MYISSKTLFTWIIFSFPFLCFFSHLCFSFSFFQISITSYNIRFIRDWASYCFSIYFLWGYVSFMTRTTSLTRFTRVFLSFPDFFLNFILQYWVDSKLDFLICFGLNSMRLSSSHDSGHEFGGLTCVDSSYFFVSFF
jgi:hypothetical protein